MTKQEAQRIAESKLKELQRSSQIGLAILENKTLEFEFGWLFLYQSKEYIKTGNKSKLVGGNAPIIVDKLNSSVHVTGTRMSKEFYIKKYCEFRNDPQRFKQEIS